MVIKISFLRGTFPFAGSPWGISCICLHGQWPVGWIAVFLDFYLSPFCLQLPGIKARLAFGAICPRCIGRTVLLISAVKYLQEIHLGFSPVGTHGNRWSPKKIISPYSVTVDHSTLPLAAQTATFRVWWPKPPVLIWGGLRAWKPRETSAFHAPTQIIIASVCGTRYLPGVFLTHFVHVVLAH